MKRILLVALLFASVAAQAECHIRSNIKLTRKMVDSEPTDVQRIVTDVAKGRQCYVQYRVFVKDHWVTAEGTGTAKTDEAACDQATDISRGVVLSEVEPSSVKASTQMVCTDFPDIMIHPVNTGDIVWESETDRHFSPEPFMNAYFELRHGKCRRFSERTARFGDMVVYQGIICRLNTTKSSKWQVVDKY